MKIKATHNSHAENSFIFIRVLSREERGKVAENIEDIINVNNVEVSVLYGLSEYVVYPVEVVTIIDRKTVLLW